MTHGAPWRPPERAFGNLCGLTKSSLPPKNCRFRIRIQRIAFWPLQQKFLA